MIILMNILDSILLQLLFVSQGQQYNSKVKEQDFYTQKSLSCIFILCGLVCLN